MIPGLGRILGRIPGSRRPPGEGNGNPLQYSCLANPMDRGAWRATDSQEADMTWQLNHHHCPYYMKVCSSTSAVSLSCCEFSFFLSSSFLFCLALPLTGVHVPMPYTLPLQALGENNGLGKREMRAYADLILSLSQEQYFYLHVPLVQPESYSTSSIGHW